MPRNISGTSINNSGGGNELPLQKQKSGSNNDEVRLFIRGSTDRNIIKQELLYCDDYIISCTEYPIDYFELYDEFIDDF